MTIQPGVTVGGPHLANGVQTSFTFGFKIYASTDLEVIQTIAAVESVISPISYTVPASSLGNDAGGVVNFSVAPANGSYITVRLAPPVEQQTNLRNQGQYNPETVERQFDRIVMILQKHDEELSRSVKVDISSGISATDYLSTAQAAALTATAQATSATASALLASQWASLTTALVAATDNSAKSWAIGGTGAGQPAAGDAKRWATYLIATVDGAEYSAKAYAQHTGLPGGTAKDWAQMTGAYVTGTSQSAKEWAIGTFQRGAAGFGSAKDWATYTGGTVDNVEYSAKYYAALAATFNPALYLLKSDNLASVASAATARGNLSAAQSGANGDITSLTALASINNGFLAGLRNRVINGNMRISVENGASAVSVSGGAAPYILDQWVAFANGAGVYTGQQNSGALLSEGFNNSLLFTVTTADASIAATDAYHFFTPIEGYTIADLKYGQATAKAVTVSFWVRSSVTGTYGLSIKNSAVNRAYVATYTINAANTWEYKTVTIPGDTSGTWLIDNGIGMYLAWSLSNGSNFQGAAGAWGANGNYTTSAQANWMATIGNTFQITGVQLEVGSQATPFENRPYGVELDLCERYYQQWVAAAIGHGFGIGSCEGSSRGQAVIQLSRRMRTSPTISVSAASNFRVEMGTVNAVGSSWIDNSYTITRNIINLDINTGAGTFTNGMASRITAVNTSASVKASARM